MTSSALLALALAAEVATPPAGCTPHELALAGLGSATEELARDAQLAGAAPLGMWLTRRASNPRPLWLCDGPAPDRAALEDPSPEPAPRWDVVPPTWFSTYHQDWSDDRNDGALFGGKGLSTQLAAGLRLRWGRFTAQLAPSLAWQQNLAFRVHPAPLAPPWSPWANGFNPGIIDLPLRMGPGAFWTPDPGQSYLRVDLGWFAAGLSTENIWWGPGVRNSILFTNSAAGFPHLFLGTGRPIDVWIGDLAVETLWGQVRDSKWLHADGHVDRRMISATALTFAPSFQRNLSLGMGRVWIFSDTRVTAARLYATLLPPILQVADLRFRSKDADNQVAALFFRWAFPEVAFELWGDWGRDDWPAGLFAGLEEPGYSQAFSFGLAKLFPWRRGLLRLQAEMTHTYEMVPANAMHQTAIFYSHDSGTGYTHAGQMLGAGVGPQADTQFLAVDWLHPAGHRLGVYGERVLRNERYYYAVAVPGRIGNLRHDLAYTLGLRGSWNRGEWEVSGELGATHRLDAFFERARGGPDAWLTVRWWPGRTAVPALAPRRAAEAG